MFLIIDEFGSLFKAETLDKDMLSAQEGGYLTIVQVEGTPVTVESLDSDSIEFTTDEIKDWVPVTGDADGVEKEED